MALQGKTATTFTYYSVINGKNVVYFHAQIPVTGKSTFSVQIQDQALYEANKAECRADEDKFRKLVREKEDERDSALKAEEVQNEDN
ncbi:MAG: hypothetical protein IJZ34_11005 [Lachnospiraceae bacterium]|nr:hypothetical protein [Lachnospiraceae bacterium]